MRISLYLKTVALTIGALGWAIVRIQSEEVPASKLIRKSDQKVAPHADVELAFERNGVEEGDDIDVKLTIRNRMESQWPIVFHEPSVGGKTLRCNIRKIGEEPQHVTYSAGDSGLGTQRHFKLRTGDIRETLTPLFECGLYGKKWLDPGTYEIQAVYTMGNLVKGYSYDMGGDHVIVNRRLVEIDREHELLSNVVRLEVRPVPSERKEALEAAKAFLRTNSDAPYLDQKQRWSEAPSVLKGKFKALFQEILKHRHSPSMEARLYWHYYAHCGALTEDEKDYQLEVLEMLSRKMLTPAWKERVFLELGGRYQQKYAEGSPFNLEWAFRSRDAYREASHTARGKERLDRINMTLKEKGVPIPE